MPIEIDFSVCIYNWSILSNMLYFFVGLLYFHVKSNNHLFHFFGRILTIISSNDNALKVLGEVMGNLEDGGSVSIKTNKK